MYKNKRQQQVIDLLMKKGIITVSELSEEFNSSYMTIRRDLDYLEEKGVVRRIHGGAIYLKNDDVLPTFRERIEKNASEKTAISKVAMSLINKDSIVCFDAGSTTLSIVQHIPNDMSLTIITTGIMTSVALCRFNHIEVIQVGGLVQHSSYTAYGATLSTDFINKFNADIAFLSTPAFSETQGTFESNIYFVEEKRRLASISKKVVLLIDYSKFNETSLCKGLTLADIDVIITDNKAPQDSVKKLRENGKEVIIAVP